MSKPNQWTRTTQPMVKWLEPRVLLHSAQEVVLSGLFANFADKRETVGGLHPTGEDLPYFDYSGESKPGASFWFDYASDVGDGFSSTYAIAQLLAKNVEIPGTLPATKQGRFVVLGGDQVYPSASWERYDVRFRWPYDLASREANAKDADLYAIPGNHDWYDGLTNFMRLFCQRSKIGTWQTRQRRSYFAIKLPHNWWVWGIDIQFDAYVDGPQIEYFTDIATKYTRAHDKVILATAKPSWVHVDDPADPPVSWKSLAWFDDHVICKNNATLALTITGDIHHYARYDQSSDDQNVEGITLGGKLTAGGGGAFLSPTHQLPDTLELPPSTPTGSDEKPEPVTYKRRSEWPTVADSKKLARGFRAHAWPWTTWRLGKVLATVYLLTALVIAIGVKDRDTSFAGSVDAGLGTLLGDSVTVWLLALVVGLALGLRAWAIYGEAAGGAGVLHAVVQIAIAWFATLVLLAWAPFGLAEHGFWLGYAVAAAVAVIGVLVGRLVLVLYIVLCNRHNGDWHANEVFAGQSLDSYKNFLRFKLDGPNALTVYAVGVKDVPRYADGLTEAAVKNAKQKPEPTLIETLKVQAPPKL